MEYRNETFDRERALYGESGLNVVGCRFDGPADGESALKECSNLTVEGCYFNLRYPLWHVDTAVLTDCEMTEHCRAALWYGHHIHIVNSRLGGIKALRECTHVTLRNTGVVSQEFLWRCRNVTLDGCTISSEYPLFECRDVSAAGLALTGKYSFQYTENAMLRDCVLDTKDAFWHAKNVTVCDSVLKGEYLGWYSENLRLVRCRIIGTQPLCYCKGLVLEDCTMQAADLCFERSEVQANIRGSILSVKNPSPGSRIVADSYGEVILEPRYSSPEKLRIIVR